MYNIFAIICFLKKEKLILVQNSIEHTADAVGIVAMTTCLFETWLSNTASVTPLPVFGTWQVVSGNACKTLNCRNKLNQELLTAFAATGYCAVLCLLFTGFKTFYVVLCRFMSFCVIMWKMALRDIVSLQAWTRGTELGRLTESARSTLVQRSFSACKSVENNEWSSSTERAQLEQTSWKHTAINKNSKRNKQRELWEV